MKCVFHAIAFAGLGCAACDRAETPNAHSTAPENPPPAPTPAPAVAPPDAPVATAPPVPHVPPVARWSAKPADRARPRWPACITSPERFIQYAEIDDQGAPRFCMWSSPDLSTMQVGCWRVDLATGTYAAETGVWFAAPVPERDDLRAPFHLAPDLVLDRDGRIQIVDARGKPARTIKSPACHAR